MEDCMSLRPCLARGALGAAWLAGLLTAQPTLAQNAGPPSSGAAPYGGPARNFSPEALGASSSVQRFAITSAANERGAFLWIIDAVEHKVTLCERTVAAGDFSCVKKALP
jgi:hypothetical protein